LVVTGKTSERVQPLLDQLAQNHVQAELFSVSGEPVLETIRAGVAAARQADAVFVIAIGGGSALDTGKAIAAMLGNPGDVLDYLEVIGRGQTLTKPSAPFVAIPTTSGTGSEVTRNAVLGSHEHRSKVSLRSSSMLPSVALVDPELTHDLPPGITASTGLDALTQLIEPYVCLRANPITDGFCIEGIRRAATSLRPAVEDGKNPYARENMSLASVLGGLSLANAGLGAVHGMAGPFGGMFNAPHGAICAVLLPHVMEVNVRALEQRAPKSPALQRYAEIARLLTGRPAASTSNGIQWVQKLVESLKIPPLRTYGAKPDDAAELIEKSQRASSMKANPIQLTNEELTKVFLEAL
jgi:alcohol dehydrogenase class IV